MVDIKVHEGFVENILEEANNVRTLKINVPKFPYLSSNFVMVSFPKLKDVWRAFSLASAPTETEIKITAKLNKSGKLTPYIVNKLKEGDKILLKGPFGHFTYTENDDTDHVVLIAAGCGIAPMRSIMRYIYDKNLQTKVTLLYTSRNEHDIVYYKEFTEVFSKRNNFKICLSLTQPDNEWTCMTGRIGKEAIKNNVKFTEKTTCYICGPISMVNETKELLKSLNVKEERIKTEAW